MINPQQIKFIQMGTIIRFNIFFYVIATFELINWSNIYAKLRKYS